MGTLSDDERRVVAEQRLGFVVTGCPNGTPNLSLKGTVAAWAVNQLVVADIASLRRVRTCAGDRPSTSTWST